MNIELTDKQLATILDVMNRGAEDFALAATYADNGYTDADIEQFEADYYDALTALGGLCGATTDWTGHRCGLLRDHSGRHACIDEHHPEDGNFVWYGDEDGFYEVAQ